MSRPKKATTVLLVGLGLLLSAPAGASALVVETKPFEIGAFLSLTDPSGLDDQVQINRVVPAPGSTQDLEIINTVGVTAATPNCTQVEPTRVRCTSNLDFLIVYLRRGNDRLTHGPGLGFRGNVTGGPGNDTLIGTERSDTLVGDSGNDRIVGLGGSDDCFGGKGRDRCLGGPGRDLCDGGPGERDRAVACERKVKFP